MWKIILHIFLLNMGGTIEFMCYEGLFAYSMEKRNRFFIRFAGSLAVIFTALFAISCVYFLLLSEVYDYDMKSAQWANVLLTFILFFFNTGMLFFCLKERPMHILYVAIAGKSSSIIASSLYSLLNNITGSSSVYMLLVATPDAPVDVYSVVFFILSHALVLTLTFFLFGRPFARMKSVFGKTINAYVLILFAVILCVVMFFQGNTEVFYITESKSVHNLFSFFIILFCFTVLFVVRFMLFWISDREEKEAAEAFRTNYVKQAELLQRSMETVNIKCHDLKHQLGGLLEKHNLDRQFVEEVQKSISIYDTHISTGNEQLDVILTEKSLVCEVNGIELTAMIDGAALSFMSAPDMNSLFGNALDNAIEHLAEETKDNRFIRISSHKNNDFFVIRIENYCSCPPEIDEKGFPVTTKRDKSNHGFGVRSMRQTVEKYKGVLTYTAGDGLFVLCMLFPFAYVSVNKLQSM